MGILSHHAIVVTATYGDFAEKGHAKALTIFGEDGVSELSKVAVNGARTFCVWPDGSKEGWADSEQSDVDRDLFVEWLGRQRYGDGSTPYVWAEIEMGECGSPTGNEGATVRRHYWKGIRLARYSGPAEVAAADTAHRSSDARNKS